jgi:RNA polymerase sigma factor (sigma-70 family)
MFTGTGYLRRRSRSNGRGGLAVGRGLVEDAPSQAPKVTPEQLFVSQLAVIERAISWVCARRCLRGADAEDFGSIVKSRLIEKDYEVFAKFEGRSSLKTYIVAVINRMYLDFQVRRFGKWRSSAEARRVGSVAVRLECLLYRDGLTFDEACGVLQADPRMVETRDALYSLSLRLPRRRRRQDGDAPEPKSPDRPSSGLERVERQALAERTFSAIRRSIAQLPERDRLFLRLHLEQGLTVAEACRWLGLEQKALYRKKERMLESLRADLEREGIGSREAQELLSEQDWDAVLTVDEPAVGLLPENDLPRPSLPLRDAVPPGGGR